MVVSRTEAAGDGTVPFWSALPRSGQKQVVINEHSTVFTGMAFKAVFYRLLGGDLGPALESIESGKTLDPDALRLSIPTQVIECGKSFELLLVPRLPLASIEGVLTLHRLDDKGDPAAVASEPLALSLPSRSRSEMRAAANRRGTKALPLESLTVMSSG